jgi:hypothetical protein
MNITVAVVPEVGVGNEQIGSTESSRNGQGGEGGSGRGNDHDHRESPHWSRQPVEWFSQWSVNEGLPQCSSGLKNVSLVTKISDDGQSQTAYIHAS